MTYCANVIGPLFYLLQEIPNHATYFRLFLVSFLIFSKYFWIFLIPLFCYIRFVRQEFFVRLFWYSICFHNFPDTLYFDILFYFLYFLGILRFWYNSHTSGFSWYFAFLYATFDVRCSFYFFFHIPFYWFFLIIVFPFHSLSFLFWIFVFSFLKIQISTPLCWQSRFFSINILGHSLHWQCSELL